MTLPRRRGRQPSQAFSDFLTHKEQGDWAEGVIQQSLDNSPKYVPVPYGRADDIIAGDIGFAEFYESYQDELDAIGKRPDILLFNRDGFSQEWAEKLKAPSLTEAEVVVPRAAAGLEVRSSAYLTKKFRPTTDRPYLSFTPKIEDLLVILKWISAYGVPHFYVQVFFDGVYAIPFKDILLMLKDAHYEVKTSKIRGVINGQPAFVIEKNPKNQFKETIHIFLNNGAFLGDLKTPPQPVGARKELANGRLLHYVTFPATGATLDLGLLESLVAKPF